MKLLSLLRDIEPEQLPWERRKGALDADKTVRSNWRKLMNIRPREPVFQDAGSETARAFLSENFAGLAQAAQLLGGFSAHQRYLRLVSDLRQTSRLGRHLRREIVWLHRLLTFDFVGDPDAAETAYFAEIDPADPVVHELCRLAEAVHALLAAIARGPDTAEDPAGDRKGRDAAA